MSKEGLVLLNMKFKPNIKGKVNAFYTKWRKTLYNLIHSLAGRKVKTGGVPRADPIVKPGAFDLLAQNRLKALKLTRVHPKNRTGF